jgi:hypothetical protein
LTGDGWSGPTDPWPAHQRAEAQKALQHAREHGWWFKKPSSYLFGLITCQRPETGGEARLGESECVEYIYSTGGPSDGSQTAKVIRDAVRRCKHRTIEPAESRFDRADTCMDRADRVMDHVVILLEDPLRRQRARDLLLDAEQSAEDADALLVEAISEEEAADEDRRRVDMDVEALRITVSDGSVAPALVADAESQLHEASRALQPTKNRQVIERRPRYERLRARLTELKAQVGLSDE